MTNEEKEILYKDLCMRLSYGVKATTTSAVWNGTYTITGYANNRIYLDCPIFDKGDDEWRIESVKPYLRPMSSMTKKEKEERKYYISEFEYDDYWHPGQYADYVGTEGIEEYIDWLIEHHFDFRGLIEKGLALEAPEGMYTNKEE